MWNFQLIAKDYQYWALGSPVNLNHYHKVLDLQDKFWAENKDCKNELSPSFVNEIRVE